MHLQRLQAAVGLTVELHEDDIPNLDDLGMILVDKELTGYLLLLLLRAEVDMNLRARAAGACVAHLPEVVVLIAVDDMILREMLGPVARSLIVTLQALSSITFKTVT